MKMGKLSLFVAVLLGTTHIISSAEKASHPSLIQDGGLNPATRVHQLLLNRGFPNYFEFLDEKSREQILGQSLKSILDRLEVPHKGDHEAKDLETKHFFKNLNKFVQDRVSEAQPDCTANVYVAAGMVRSLLGYVYKKLYHAHIKALEKTQGSPLSEEQLREVVVERLDQIIKDGRFVNFIKALGVSSDFDIVIDFPEQMDEVQKDKVINATRDYINAAERHLGLQKDTSVIKKSVVPVADVKEYAKQFGLSAERSAVVQGGATIDWLAFKLGDGQLGDGSTSPRIRAPKGYEYILTDLLNAKLTYLECPQGFAPDKQTVRSLRGFMELVFASFDEKSETILNEEFGRLVSSGQQLSSDAQDQFVKTARNGRLEGRHNAVTMLKESVANHKLLSNVKELSERHGKPIREFLERHKISLRTEDKGDLRESGVLLKKEDILEKHTANGTVYHGTPHIEDVLCMMHNGIVVSSREQGTAAFNRGFYTAKDEGTAAGYTRGSGIVIPLTLTIHDNLRVIDLNSDAGKELFKKIEAAYPYRDPHEVLAREYDVDAIIPEKCDYVLVQNADAVKFPKDFISLLKAQVKATTEIIKRANVLNSSFNYKDASIWMNHVHPKRGYQQLLQCWGETPSQDGFKALSAYLARSLEVCNLEASQFIMFMHLSEIELRDAYRSKASDILKAYLKSLLEKEPSEAFLEQLCPLFQEGNFNIKDFDEIVQIFKPLKNQLPVMASVSKLMTAGLIKTTPWSTGIRPDLIEYLEHSNNQENLINALVSLTSVTHIDDYQFVDYLMFLEKYENLETLIHQVGQLKVRVRGQWELKEIFNTLKDLKQAGAMISSANRVLSAESMSLQDWCKNLRRLDNVTYGEKGVSAFLSLQSFLCIEYVDEKMKVIEVLGKFSNSEAITPDLLRPFQKYIQYSSDWTELLKSFGDQGDLVQNIIEMGEFVAQYEVEPVFAHDKLDHYGLKSIFETKLTNIEFLKEAKECATLLNVKDFTHLAKNVVQEGVAEGLKTKVKQIAKIFEQIQDLDFVKEDDAKIYFMTYLLSNPDSVTKLIGDPTLIINAEEKVKSVAEAKGLETAKLIGVETDPVQVNSWIASYKRSERKKVFEEFLK
ncbi:MAG: hypothetical protein K2Y18_01230 [Alphaproteobacteria bacterium]|jgi:hypothetical protein|nr:hypothetical protein [Alphaproteobacteria bacterium]